MDDPIDNGLSSGWIHIDGAQLTEDQRFESDVVIIGSGAGGATAAEILSNAGLSVMLVESGPLKSSKDFNMEESRAYSDLYQQAASMKTQDKGISILQGRAVGGSTTINWTTAIRAPRQTLEYWESEKSVSGLSDYQLTPWFELMEQRLHIKKWQLPPNPNNQVLLDGCKKLGWEHSVVNRNVKQCINLGYCGMGCPVNAKQSMLVTTIPAMLNNGGMLFSRVKATKINFNKTGFTKDKVNSISAIALDNTLKKRNISITFKAKHYVLAGGAIHTPLLMMRSNATDPHKLLGKRTFLHPSIFSVAEFDETINAHSGAPQSVVSDEFLWSNSSNELGYKLEVPPIHPMMLATKSLGFGAEHANFMKKFNHIHACIALLRDGFSSESQGGEVLLTDLGFKLDYPLTQLFWTSARRALLNMAEIQFAAGAKQVLPISDGLEFYSSWNKLKDALEMTELKTLTTPVGSAHVMGGCAMGNDLQKASVDCYGRSYYYDNLSVMDGSIFPTSLGANPQLTIYAITARNATYLAQELTKS